MKDEEEFEESIDELISYEEADDTTDTDTSEADFDTEEDLSETDVVTEQYDDFDVEDDYDVEIVTDAPEVAEEETPPVKVSETEPSANTHETEYFNDLDYEYDDDEQDLKDKKSIRHLGIILTISVLVMAFIAFLSIDTGFIGNYKANFKRNFSKLFGNLFTANQVTQQYEEPKEKSRYNTSIQNSKVTSLDDFMNAKLLPYKDGVICASPNKLSYIDSNGNIAWEETTLIVDPILSVQGDNILLAEKGRHKVCLYNDKRLVYEANDPDNITTASVSSSGDCVLITDKANYRGGISVYNKTGEQIYSWASGSYAVIAADICPKSRKIAVSLLNTETEAKSILMFFNINEKNSFSQINVENTVVYKLAFSGDRLTAFGDNRITVLSDTGEVINDNSLDDVQLTHFAIDNDGNKLISYDNGIVPMLKSYDKQGKETSTSEISGVCNYIDIDGKTIIYSIGKDIYCGRNSIDNMTKFTATMDIKDLMLISHNTFLIQYTNSIEIVRI